MSTDTFQAWGNDLPLFDHPYNTTRLNERAVEVSVALAWLAGVDAPGAIGLEVGNVMHHYGLTDHAVVDLHERAEGVENLDVFAVDGTFDWILAISTVEHVGWDDSPRRIGASREAIEHLRGCLRPDAGRLLVTVPMGYNTPLDQAIVGGWLTPLTGATFIRSGSGWVQTKRPVLAPYGISQPWAQAVWIAEFDPC